MIRGNSFLSGQAFSSTLGHQLDTKGEVVRGKDIHGQFGSDAWFFEVCQETGRNKSGRSETRKSTDEACTHTYVSGDKVCAALNLITKFTRGHLPWSKNAYYDLPRGCQRASVLIYPSAFTKGPQMG